MLRIEKEKRHFLRKQANTTKEYHCICKSLPEYLISQSALSLSSNYNPEHVIRHAKRQIFNIAPNFASASRLFTIQNTSNSQSKTYLRKFFLQNSSQQLLSKMSVIFLERQKQFSIPPQCLIQSKSCDCIKIKILVIHILKNHPNLSNLLMRKTTYICSFKTSLIIKELNMHENKSSRKVFHTMANLVVPNLVRGGSVPKTIDRNL